MEGLARATSFVTHLRSRLVRIGGFGAGDLLQEPGEETLASVVRFFQLFGV